MPSSAWEAASRIAAAISRATSSGPPVVGVGRRACPSTLFFASTTTVWILVPAEIDSAARGRRRGWAHGQTISVGSEGFGKL